MMIKPHHIMTKAEIIMKNLQNIMPKLHHVTEYGRYNMTGPHHIMTKRQNVMINDHIRQLWLSIENYHSRCIAPVKSRTRRVYCKFNLLLKGDLNWQKGATSHCKLFNVLIFAYIYNVIPLILLQNRLKITIIL